MTPASLTDLFLTIAAISWRGGLLILAVIALRPFVRGRIPAQIWFGLWVVVAIRLLIPFSIPTAWSPYNLLTPKPDAVPAVSGLAPLAASDPSGPPETTPLPGAPLLTTVVAAHPDAAFVGGNPVAARKRSVWDNLARAWAAGVSLLAVTWLAGSWRLRRRLGRARPIKNACLNGIVTDELSSWGGWSPRCLETEAVNAPALFGIVRPRLLFPPGLVEKLTVDELRLVVRHELGHLRRQDLLAQRLLHVAVILHWFNPLAWCAAWLARIDCELACDEHVLRHDSSPADAYVAVLLKVLGFVRGRSNAFGVVGILENRQRLAYRLTTIAGYRPASLLRAVAGVGLILNVAATSMTREAKGAEKAGTPIAAAAAVPGAAPTNDLKATVDQQQTRVERMARELQEYKEKKNLPSLDRRRDILNDSLKAVSTEVTKTVIALNAARARVEQVGAYRARGAALTALPFIASDARVAGLTQQLSTARMTVGELNRKYGDAHPEMIRATRFVAATENELQQAVDAACAQVQAEFDAATRVHDAAEQELQKLKAEALHLDRDAVEYNDQERKLRTQEQILQNLTARFQEAATAGDMSVTPPRAKSPGEFAISVVGAVGQQGAVVFALQEKPIALDAIARAGGFVPHSDRAAIRLVRLKPDGSRTTITLTEDALMSGGPESVLRPGDVVVVPTLPDFSAFKRDFGEFNVLGAVNHPGAYSFGSDRKLTLVDALTKAGGASRLANLKQVRVTRIDVPNKSTKVFVLDVDSFLKGSADADPHANWDAFVPQPGDIIFVPERVL